MDIEQFIQNIKLLCEKRGIKPTVACREAGVGGSFINNMESRGSIPSVEKTQMLARYLGTTVSELIGESSPPRPAFNWNQPLTLHDSAAGNWKPDHISLSVQEVDLMRCYKNAPPEVQLAVQDMLNRYKTDTTSGVS